MNHGSNNTEIRDATIANLAIQGIPQQAIAEQVGLHRSQVSRVLDKDKSKAIIENHLAKVIDLAPQAFQNIKDMMADPKQRYKSTELWHKIVGITGNLTAGNVFIQQVYQDNRSITLSPEVKGLLTGGLQSQTGSDIIDIEE